MPSDEEIRKSLEERDEVFIAFDMIAACYERQGQCAVRLALAAQQTDPVMVSVEDLARIMGK